MGGVVPEVCGGLTLTGAPRKLMTDQAKEQVQVLLSFLGGTQAEVIAGVVHPTSPASMAGMSLISFAPWSTWPDQLSAGGFLPGTFDFDRVLLAPGVSLNTVAVVAPIVPLIPDGGPTRGLQIKNGVPPGGESGPWLTLVKDTVYERPIALAASPGGLLEIDEYRVDSAESHLRLLETSGAAVVDVALGCSDFRLEASIAQVNSTDTLIAYTSIAGSCTDTPKPISQPAGALRMALVEAKNNVVFLHKIASMPLPDQPDRLSFLRLVASEQGAWMVYQYQATKTDVLTPYLAIPLDPQGNPLAPAMEVLGPSVPVLAPAVAAFGKHLILAYSPVASSPNPIVTVDLWDTPGQPTSSYSFDGQEASLGGATTLLVGPANDLLVGWSENDAPHPQTYLARLACSSP